jgi:hypothetical protein
MQKNQYKAYEWPVGVMKYKRACTRLSLNLGLRLMRDSSAKILSYSRSRWPTISWKLLEWLDSTFWWQTQRKYVRELVVNIVTEARSVYNGKSDANTILVELYGLHQDKEQTKICFTARTDVDRLDSDAFLNMSRLRVVCNFMSEDFWFTQSVDKCSSPSTGGTYSMLNI